MQLRLDAADRLVELVEERRGPVPAEEAARRLFALRRLPDGVARGLLEEAVRADSRLAWRGDLVALAEPAAESLPLELARFVVVDLETTGLSPATARICEIGAVRVEALELTARFETLANPGMRLAPAVGALTGIDDEELRRAPPVAAAVRRFLAFAGDSVLVAHNARFDLAFLDRETERQTGRRIAAPVIDTVGLARRLLAGRTSRAGLASLARFFGTSVRPCHRALPDARGDGGDPALPDRARAGARRRDGRRPPGAGGDARPPRPREALARLRRAGAARRLPLPRPRRPGALRRQGARPAGAAALVLPLRAAAAGGGGGAAARSTASSGACWAPSSRPGSRSCASCASCVRRRTRAAPGPTATSTCGRAARTWS